MKKIFKYIIPCLTFALVMASCNDTMDDKAVIDALYDNLEDPIVLVSSAEADTYETGMAFGAIEDLSNVQEVGFQLSTDASFDDYVIFVCDEVANSFSAELSGLEEKTTYYVRSYVFTKTGKTLYSEAIAFTTPKAPIYEIDGTYTVTEYDMESGEAGSTTYQMEVYFDEENPNKVYLYNLWDGGEVITGVYNATANTITVPTTQVIYQYPGYGPVYALSFNDSMTAQTKSTTFTFTPLGGTMVSGIMAAYLPAAQYLFGYFAVSMKHNDDVEK